MRRSWLQILTRSPFYLAKNLKQGRQVVELLKIALDTPESVFVDVGSHKGEVLSMALKIAPKGDHYAFEAIPAFFDKLSAEFKNYAYLQNVAVTNYVGTTMFNFVESNPSLSGIKQRDYPKSEKISEINLKTTTLDRALSNAQRVDLIRIDVEGGEYDVIDGAKQTIFKHQPIILFEHQQGAADYYDANPDKIWDILIDQLGMKLYTLNSYLESKKPITKSMLQLLFDTGQETLFIADFN